MNFIKDNGGPIALVVILLGFCAGYIELRLPSEADLQAKVDAKFVVAGAVPPHRVEMIEDDIVDLEKEDTRMYDKMERMAQILMEE
jgi:hypothetical protein